MKKIITFSICLLLLSLIVFRGISSTLVFENSDYKVFMPSGAPISEWEKIDEYYSTAYCGFSMTNTVLLNNDLDTFEEIFCNCYNKFSLNDDVYAIMASVFLSEEIKYSKTQVDRLITVLEQIYNEEKKKAEPNFFLLEKNIMLRIEINYKNGRFFDALALKNKLES